MDKRYVVGVVANSVQFWQGKTDSMGFTQALVTYLGKDNVVLINPFDHAIIPDHISHIILTGSEINISSQDEISTSLLQNLRVLYIDIKKRKIPCLAICFGFQAILQIEGAKIKRNPLGFHSSKSAQIAILNSILFDDGLLFMNVVAKHGDIVIDVPLHVKIRGVHIERQEIACVEIHDHIVGIQFHVMGSQDGNIFLESFLML